jgi:hypothetical protein
MKSIIVYLLKAADGMVSAACDDLSLDCETKYQAEAKALTVQQYAGLHLPCFLTVHIPM